MPENQNQEVNSGALTQISINIPPQIHRQFKVKLRKQRMTMKGFLEYAMKKYVNED